MRRKAFMFVVLVCLFMIWSVPVLGAESDNAVINVSATVAEYIALDLDTSSINFSTLALGSLNESSLGFSVQANYDGWKITIRPEGLTNKMTGIDGNNNTVELVRPLQVALDGGTYLDLNLNGNVFDSLDVSTIGSVGTYNYTLNLNQPLAVTDQKLTYQLGLQIEISPSY